MDTVIQIASSVLIGLGCLFLLSGSVGLLRFPDFYARTHAASVTDTLASPLILLGLMLLAGWSLVLAKLIMILLFALLTSPTAGHALGKAAQHGGLRAQLADDDQPNQ